MTVKELKEKLADYPEDTVVYTNFGTVKNCVFGKLMLVNYKNEKNIEENMVLINT